MPSAAAELAKPSRSAAALRRLACETILNLRSSVVQHPRGDAIPNPFPPPALNLRNLKHCVSPSFSKHLCCEHTFRSNPGQAPNFASTSVEPLWAAQSHRARHYAHTCFSFVLQEFMQNKNERFQLWRRCAITLAPPGARGLND